MDYLLLTRSLDAALQMPSVAMMLGYDVIVAGHVVLNDSKYFAIAAIAATDNICSLNFPSTVTITPRSGSLVVVESFISSFPSLMV